MICQICKCDGAAYPLYVKTGEGRYGYKAVCMNCFTPHGLQYNIPLLVKYSGNYDADMRLYFENAELTPEQYIECWYDERLLLDSGAGTDSDSRGH